MGEVVQLYPGAGPTPSPLRVHVGRHSVPGAGLPLGKGLASVTWVQTSRGVECVCSFPVGVDEKRLRADLLRLAAAFGGPAPVCPA